MLKCGVRIVIVVLQCEVSCDGGASWGLVGYGGCGVGVGGCGAMLAGCGGGAGAGNGRVMGVVVVGGVKERARGIPNKGKKCFYSK